MRNIFVGAGLVLVLAAAPTYAEKVHIKYRDADVDLRKFECHDITKGPEVRRICYDKSNNYEATVKGLQGADSPDDYYHKSVRGHFDCRTHRIPQY
jgi:hypothetical protein